MRQLVSLMVNTKISAIKVSLRSSVDNWLVRKLLEAALTGSGLKTFIIWLVAVIGLALS